MNRVKVKLLIIWKFSKNRVEKRLKKSKKYVDKNEARWYDKKVLRQEIKTYKYTINIWYVN